MAYFFKKSLAMNFPGIHIGTSGWSYKHWRGLYYPTGVKVADWLPFYARSFSSTEINGSFYRLPSEETVKRWVEQVPPDFTFCPKMSRFLTHMKKLKDPEEPLERFFGVFEYMKRKMGPVLIQLPPQLKFNYDVAIYFYRLLTTTYSSYQFVVEVRHDSWLEPDSISLMNQYQIGFVISHSHQAFPYMELVTAKHIYVRFHGPGHLYASSYSEALLQEYAGKFCRWREEGHVVWAYFNNDVHGYAVTDALRLKEMVQTKMAA
jgi:uncharacterized protein YecE (DUF72 family)